MGVVNSRHGYVRVYINCSMLLIVSIAYFGSSFYMYNYLIHRLFLSKPLLHVLSGHIYTFSINTLAYIMHYCIDLINYYNCSYAFTYLLYLIFVCVCARVHTRVCVCLCAQNGQ